jgi:hypothetical protein
MPIDKFSGQWIPTRPFGQEEPLSLEHRKQIHRFVDGAGVPFEDAADRSQRAYARFKAWHHEQQVAYAEELKSQGKEPPAPEY